VSFFDIRHTPRIDLYIDLILRSLVAHLPLNIQQLNLRLESHLHILRHNLSSLNHLRDVALFPGLRNQLFHESLGKLRGGDSHRRAHLLPEEGDTGRQPRVILLLGGETALLALPQHAQPYNKM